MAPVTISKVIKDNKPKNQIGKHCDKVVRISPQYTRDIKPTHHRLTSLYSASYSVQLKRQELCHKKFTVMITTEE